MKHRGSSHSKQNTITSPLPFLASLSWSLLPLCALSSIHFWKNVCVNPWYPCCSQLFRLKLASKLVSITGLQSNTLSLDAGLDVILNRPIELSSNWLFSHWSWRLDNWGANSQYWHCAIRAVGLAEWPHLRVLICRRSQCNLSQPSWCWGIMLPTPMYYSSFCKIWNWCG